MQCKARDLPFAYAPSMRRLPQIMFYDVKLDGWSFSIGLSELNKPFALGRTRDAYEKLRGCKWLRDLLMRLPSDTAVMGELFVPGKPASEVPRAICRCPETLRFGAFALQRWHGEDCESLEADESESRLISLGCKVPPREWWTYGDPVTKEHCAQALQVLQDAVGRGEYSPDKGYVNITPDDIEGIVLKASHLSGWYKYKPIRSVDLIVLDVKMSTSISLSGQISSLVCGTVDGRIVADVGGFVADERDNMSTDDVGRVVEVKFQYLGSGGRLRHPRFSRWRDDKPKEECTWKSVLAANGKVTE